ncbi:MAG TPA: hypothetical protein VLT61_02305, partial [Anaeromyxobacteraceae bacterium]|nr:hypothetical protein [Anaeromyxobacteraceae bacterium]
MRRLITASVCSLVLAAPAGAQVFPSRSGEVGILDVPDAEVLGTGGGALAAEVRLDKVSGEPVDVGPLPLYTTAGITSRLDLGLTMREWGQPGDPHPASVAFGAAAKLQLTPPTGTIPGFAVGFVADRINASPFYGLRLSSSTGRIGLVRAAAFLGAETHSDSFSVAGLTAGGAISVLLPYRLEAVGEALVTPRGPNVGAGLRWQVTPTIAVGTSLNYLPDDDGVRFSAMLAFTPPFKARAAIAEGKPSAAPGEEAPSALVLALGDRPAFRLRIHTSGPDVAGEPRHRQHGVRVAIAEQLPAGPKAVQQGAAAGPSAEDVFESQLRDQDAAADARERRLKATEESLRQRDAAVTAEAQQLESRDQQLASREIQLDAREKRIVLRGPPSQAERAIESREAQLGTQERALAAQERGFQPSLETAAGRERDAGAREQVERADAERLGDEWKRAKDRVSQLDVRRQALSARQRQLGAVEARLLAMGERIDAAERQVRTRAERLDAWQRRLDARAERLELLERRSGEQRKPTESPKPTETAPATGAEAKPKDKAVFVMVVKAPTAIMKEQAPGTTPATAAAPASGAAVEKAVAAATVVAFPTPTSELSELDRESIENIAKLAAKENCELLVWARAKSPALMNEAQRRADDIKKRAVAAGPIDAKRVVTRVTTRPGATGVDVVVSALREQGGAKPAQPAAPAGGAPAPGIQMLGSGETGKRQIRDAVLRAQPAIEACVGDQIQRKKLSRAEGVLKLTVAANGRVVIVK